MATPLLIILFAFFVQFTDKAGSEHIALSQQALDKRAERNIALDSMDYAVSPIYIDSLRKIGCHIYHTSRWMNGATIEADTITIQTIAQWSFVEKVEMTRKKEQWTMKNDLLAMSNGQWAIDNGQKASDVQTELLNLHLLHEAGFRGEGITMCIIDGGFQHVDTLGAFSAAHEEKRILGIYDMTDDIDSITGETGNHGSKCFSTIAAITDDYHGTAIEAQYYLIRSEENLTESPKEMDNWVAAIELADSLGVDIVSTSLGYSIFDDNQFTLSYADMDGQSTRSSRAATIASRKGMLMVVAAGNDGNKPWHYIASPADADSILTVGAVDIYDSIAPFSSWGPTADGRVKPEVCAVGYQTTLINPVNNSVVKGNGTSFACPLIAGMAACLWSAIPNANNMEIREMIIRSANRYHSPHEQYGYGIPDAWEAYQHATHLPQISHPQQSATKLLINGELWIDYQGNLYNLMGQKKG
ncbi:MAG: S8 family serine peptidase [Paludibacteraceae bacterium]|nr:S8 family serine peptidase [Paludibacteraceae bacterium]